MKNTPALYPGEDNTGTYYFTDSPQWEEVYIKEVIPAQKRVFDHVERIKEGEEKEKTRLGSNHVPIIFLPMHMDGLFLDHLPDLSNFQVNGDYTANDNQLTSLKGMPKYVFGYCTVNYNKLTSLEHAPLYVDGRFSFTGNQITSLEGIPYAVEGCRFGENPGNFTKEQVQDALDKAFAKLPVKLQQRARTKNSGKIF
jgi:hypothetical protein